MSHDTAIVGKVVTPFGVIERGMVAVQGDRISRVGPPDEQALEASAEVLEYTDRYIIPGFVDIHCHGGADGRCYDDPVSFFQHHLDHGTTSILPTLDYNQTHGHIMSSLVLLSEAMKHEQSSIIGIHMEGPYINPKYGAITSPIRPVNRAEYREILEAAGDRIRLWTLAPELDGQTEFMEEASRYGITLSVGHSEATPETIFAGYRYGLRVGCHLTNASGTTPETARFGGTREVGVHEAVLLHDEMYAEVIPDKAGIHVRPLMLRLILKTKGADRVIIITDATGYQPNPTEPDVRIIRGNVNSPTGEGSELLSGSLLTMNQAVRNMMRHTGAGIVDACKMSSLNPARLLGLDSDLGSLEVGRVANILAVSGDMDIAMVMLRGRHRVDG